MPETERAVEVHPPLGGYNKTRARLKYRGKVGRLWGGMRGLFSAFAIPGIGSALVAGPLAWISGAMEVVGLGAIGAGFYAMGIRRDRVIQRETAPQTDKLLTVGTEQPLTSGEEQ